MARKILNVSNFLVTLVVALCILSAAGYAIYSLWDDQRIYTTAENVQADMLRYKPVIDEDGKASFEELQAINSDVCAWITLDGTNIDYPVLQGSTNLTYINKDVYGNFALSGSIFLDSRNNRDFTDSYNLLYGHHMAESKMFGDLDKYKEETFFEENKSGMLLLPDSSYKLEIFACLLTGAGEDEIFDPEKWQTDIDGLLSFVEANSLHLRNELLEELRQMDNGKVLAMSTCSTDFTDARTIILAVMEPYQTAD